MATDEHKFLAEIIKNTHATLREEAQNYGPEIAWRRHVSRKDVLQKYAASMQKLATTYWTENNSDLKLDTHCRVTWVKHQCKEYFFNGGRQKYDERENCIKLKINEHEIAQLPKDIIITEKVTLLDVGSCYNPFGKENIFDVTAIDLHGIPGKVLQCDFLNVDTGNVKVLSSNGQEILQLPESSFDVVVFSLFLEYLPCPEQRYICCKKAYNLLKCGGILCIITPDSKHVNANAKFMKSWRYVLSKLGFMRIKYEKLQHLHCIIFRKCMYKNVALRWADLQNPPDNDPLYLCTNAIYIPQDFRNSANKDKEQIVQKYNTDELSSMFSELPFDIT